ncbi:MAG: hypothetical protein R3F07_11415 [Opitutaceae bacterium]
MRTSLPRQPHHHAQVLGRSLDELPPQTRRLLGLLEGMVAEISRKKGIDRDQCVFTRREVRAFTGWSEFQTRTHLSKLQDMEYVLAHYGRRGQNFVYELTFDGDAESKRPQLIGLIDVDRLKSEGAIKKCRAPKRPLRAANRPSSSPLRETASTKTSSPSVVCAEPRGNPENHKGPLEARAVS